MCAGICMHADLLKAFTLMGAMSYNNIIIMIQLLSDKFAIPKIKAYSSVLQYSGTSHNGLSEIRTASIQWTNHVPPIDFDMEITHF